MGYSLLDQLKLIHSEVIYKNLEKGSWNDETIRGILLSLGKLKEKLNKYDTYELEMLQIHASSYYKNSQVTWAQSAIIVFNFTLLAFIATNIIPSVIALYDYFGYLVVIFIIGIFVWIRREILREKRCRFASILLSELIQHCINENTNTNNSNTSNSK